MSQSQRTTKTKKQRGTFAALAQRLGVSREAIENAISRGEITGACLEHDARGRRMLIDIDRAEREYKGAHEQNPLPPTVDFDDPDTWPTDAAGLKAVREHFAAKLAKQRSEVAAGQLVELDTVKRDLFSAARTVRDHLLRIPDRCSDSLAAALGGVEPSVVRTALATSIERALEDLAAELSKAVAMKGSDFPA